MQKKKISIDQIIIYIEQAINETSVVATVT